MENFRNMFTVTANANRSSYGSFAVGVSAQFSCLRKI